MSDEKPGTSREPRLGDRVRDRITGLVGIATGRAEYLYGVDQVLVVPALIRDGVPASGTWFDVGRCEVMDPLVHHRLVFNPAGFGR